MPIFMKSRPSAAIFQTGETGRFELFVFDETGAGVPDCELKIQLTGNPATVLQSGKVKTDVHGSVQIPFVAGSKPEAVSLNVRASGAEWSGAFFVSNVEIEYPLDLQLRDFDESLLKILFWEQPRLRVLREFGGGLSGSRVLQVQVVGERGLFLTQIVKIGPKDEMRGEKKKYETFFMNRLPNAAPISGYAEWGAYVAIIYGDANAAQSLEPVKPFANFFIEAESYRISIALSAIFKRGLRAVYRYHTIKNLTTRSILGKFLPENLVVSLRGGDAPFGVFPSGHKVKNAAKLDAQAVERLNFQVSPGESVHLQNFLISKMQEGDLNLEDIRKERFKVKVRYDGASVDNFVTGDCVDVVAQFVTDREHRLKFAVAHCLRTHGFQENPYGFGFQTKNYPNPLTLLKTILEKSIDVAWGTIHGDLHWENIMIENPSNWWLIDYGLTGEGPILFDFIKLELYLRTAVLSKVAEVTPEMLLEFEEALIENPFGLLEEPKLENPVLKKAMKTIQNIRRLAKPYIIDDFYEYLNLLFVSSVALVKYYPAESKWESAGADEKLKKSSRQTFFALAAALNLGRVLRWAQLCQKPPRLKCEFVPLGSRLEPQPNKIALDAGSKCEPGILDHHLKQFIAAGQPDEITSTASLVWQHPELITRHLTTTNPDEVTWILHEHPDFDGISATFLAWFLVKMGFLPPGANQLQKYANRVDAGAEFLENVPAPERTPYALFQFHLAEPKAYQHLTEIFEKRLFQGFALMTYFCRMESEGTHLLADNILPPDHDYWRVVEEMGQDQDLFRNSDEKVARKLTLPISDDGKKRLVPAIILEAPRSQLFKAWARSSGFPLMIVRWPQPDKPDHRIVISVPPGLLFGLKGFGAELEKAETRKRKKLDKARPVDPPRWPDVDNSDPWYDGRSPIHAYTIVDSPREGTVLTVEEVVEILEKGKWI